MMTNYQQTQTQNSPDSCSVPSVLGILGFKMDTSGSGKISSRYFAIVAKKKKKWKSDRVVQDVGVDS